MKKDTKLIAIGGILTATAIALMFFGSIVPFATFSVPALASMCVLYIMIEFGTSASVIVYLSISLLGILLVQDKEIALLFVCFFGYYPIVKAQFEKKLSPIPAFICKFVVFNGSMLALYYVITQVIVIDAVLDEFLDYSVPLLVAILLVGNIFFAIFDLALTKLISYYLMQLRERIIKLH